MFAPNASLSISPKDKKLLALLLSLLGWGTPQGLSDSSALIVGRQPLNMITEITPSLWKLFLFVVRATGAEAWPWIAN